MLLGKHNMKKWPCRGYLQQIHLDTELSQHHQLAFCTFCLIDNLSCVCLRFSLYWPVSICLSSTLISDSKLHLWFLGPMFFSESIILIELMSGCGFYSHRHLFVHQGTSLLWPFLWLVQCFVSFPTGDQLLSFRFCFVCFSVQNVFPLCLKHSVWAPVSLRHTQPALIGQLTHARATGLRSALSGFQLPVTFICTVNMVINYANGDMLP